MIERQKSENITAPVIKEFWPRTPSIERGAGILVIRQEDRKSNLGKFDRLFEIMRIDALAFVPPIELDPDDVEVIPYDSGRTRYTFGLEADIPEGHEVSSEYTRVSELQPRL